MTTTEVFNLAPFQFQGHPIEMMLSRSEPASRFFGAIMTRAALQDPTTLASIEKKRGKLKNPEGFVLSQVDEAEETFVKLPQSRGRFMEEARRYLADHPDDHIAGLVTETETAPAKAPVMWLPSRGGQVSSTAAKVKKAKAKQAAQSRRRNRH